MGLLRRRNRRSALADRRLMAQLLRGQLDRLACAKYGMRLLVFPKIFKAGLGTSGAQVTFLGTACPLGVHASGPVMPVAGFLGIGLTVSEAWRMSAFRQGLNESGYVRDFFAWPVAERARQVKRRVISGHGYPVARRCPARRRARCTRPQGRPCEEAAPAHSIAFQAMIPILATKSLPGAG